MFFQSRKQLQATSELMVDLHMAMQEFTVPPTKSSDRPIKYLMTELCGDDRLSRQPTQVYKQINDPN